MYTLYTYLYICIHICVYINIRALPASLSFSLPSPPAPFRHTPFPPSLPSHSPFSFPLPFHSCIPPLSRSNRGWREERESAKERREGVETGKEGWREGSEGRGLHMVMCRPPFVALPL